MVRRSYGPRGFVFTHLLPSHPMLAKLRSQERLDRIAGAGSDTLPRALRLKNWVCRQWEFGSPDPYPPWNALEILEWIRSGRTRGHCGQYAIVYLQACLSMGIQARFVEVGRATNPYSHFTTEVFLEEFGKWAVLDATASKNLASHYLLDGVPQNALELHDAYVKGRREKVEVVHDLSVLEGKTETSRGTALENYHFLRVFFRQDQVIRPPKFRNASDTADRYADAVEWIAKGMVPWEETEVESKYPRERLTERRTDDPEDLYWTPRV